MNVFNSRAGQHEDDSDITIINPSINEMNQDSLTNSQMPRLPSPPSGTVTTTQTTAVNQFNFPSASDPSDYIFVHHDPLENAKKIEDVLINYVRDLKKDSNTQLDCDKQLVIRLIDLIRPACSNNQQKLEELNRIRDDIGVLHDKRFVQQNEKMNELRGEIARLNRMLFTASNDQSIYEDRMESYSIYNSLPPSALVTGYSQWTEIENDAKKLHEIVQSQRNQINEIATLISQATSTTPSIEQPQPDSVNQRTSIDVKPQPTPTPSTGLDPSFLNNILSRLQNIGKRPLPIIQNSSKNDSNTTTIISTHSPGSSPSESLNTITRKTITASINEPNEPEPTDPTPAEPIRMDERSMEPEPVDDRPLEPEPADDRPLEQEQVDEPAVDPEIEQPDIVNPVPASPISSDALRSCPVCNHEFSPTCNDVEMYEHIDGCLFPIEQTNPPTEYECPRCTRRFPANNENAYLQHMSDCYNNQFDE